MLDLLRGISLILLNRLLLKLGLRKPVNGWRCGAALVLKGEAARFVLSAFSLKIFSDDPSPRSRSIEEIQQHLNNRLAKFLSSESEFFIRIRHEPDKDVVIPSPSVSYSLGFQPWTEGPSRFIRPDSWAGTLAAPGIADTSPVFEFICRINQDQQADLWVRINHVGTDGVASQEMLSRLEKAWGIAAPVIFPSTSEFEPYTTPRFSPGRPGTAEVQTFIEFGPLLDWRKKQNAKLPEPMTFGAALLWWLARHDAFSGRYFGTTVEVPDISGIGRGVGMVVVHPVDYFHKPNGLALYVRAFNRELELTRLRKSKSHQTLDAAAFLPPRLEKKLLLHALENDARAFGTVGLTILKDAKIFGAPFGDVGHIDGFIAIGSIALETSDGRRVGCVVIKGLKERISSYAKMLSQAMEKAPEEFS